MVNETFKIQKYHIELYNIGSALFWGFSHKNAFGGF